MNQNGTFRVSLTTLAAVLTALLIFCAPIAAQDAVPEALQEEEQTPAEVDEQVQQASEAAETMPVSPADEESGGVPVQSLVGPLQLLAHPVYPPEQTRLVFQPLVDYLNEATGLQIELVVERNYHRYWINARNGDAPALILEDAHMISWRMNNFDYQPLVTAGEPMTFSLLATGMEGESLNDFYGQPISTLPSPSLGFLVLTRWYSNPLQQPQIQSTATSWLDAVEMVFSAEAAAAMAPRPLAERYPNLIAVETSPEFPGLTLSASPDVPEDVRQKLIDAMIVLHANDEHHAALFEIDVDRFVPADPADYLGLDDWFRGIFRM